MALKTNAEWSRSGLSFDAYFKPGDLVDKATYMYFLEVVPPVTHNRSLMQVGEPSRHIGGKPTFATFAYVRGRDHDEERWMFCGDCFKGDTTPPVLGEDPAHPKKVFTFYATRTVVEEIEIEDDSFGAAYCKALNAEPHAWARTSSSADTIDAYMVDGDYKKLR